jgi:putative DNA-invertase from lambdoid prophage Rac
MSRVFAYLRVSTADQETANQLREIEAAGFSIERRRVTAECVSGSVPAAQRRGFAKLMDKLEAGDVLVVSRLDRLGRSAMDVRATVEQLAGLGVRVHCLALGGVDLTSAAGKMTMGVISACAEFEKDLLIERTKAGIDRAKRQGKKFGRPESLSEAQKVQVGERLKAGAAVAQLARELGVSRQTVMRAAASAA